MIIEQLRVDGPKNIFLVHIDPQNDSIRHVDQVVKWLDTVPGYSVLRVPNGHPGPTNPLPKMIIFNAENEVLKSALEKIVRQSGPGAVVPLTAEEMNAWVNSQATDWTQI